MMRNFHFVFLVSIVSALRTFEFNLTEIYTAQNGVYRSLKVINGLSPGPMIEADENDWVRVTVHNKLQVSAAIHFHGVLQRGTPWSDGAPGISQYPIPSQGTYVYEFQFLNQSGAMWYHSHFRGYSSDGIYGLIYVRPAAHRSRPYDAITTNPGDKELLYELEKKPSYLTSNDVFFHSMDEVILRMFHHGIDPLCIQSILVNGMGRVVCHSQDTFIRLALKLPFLTSIPVFDSMGCIKDSTLISYHGKPIDHGGLEPPGHCPQCRATTTNLHNHYTENRKWQYINVLNAGGQYTKAFSIDDHPFYVVAVDGVFVEPVLTHSAVLPVGSRFTICFETVADEHKNIEMPFLIRFGAINTPQFIEGNALLVYGNSDTEVPNFDTNGYNGEKFQDLDGKLVDPSHVSFWPQNSSPWESQYKLDPSEQADITYRFYLNRFDWTQFTMFEDRTTLPMSMEVSTPLLLQSSEELATTMNTSKAILQPPLQLGQTVDLIVNNYKHINHPIHLHGHYVHVISYSSHENFPFVTVQEAIEANYESVLKRPSHVDVILVPVGGHAVLRFKADNPGIWLLHCHNIGHLLGGMGAIILESLENVPRG